MQFYHQKHLIIFRKDGGMGENEYEQIKYIHTNNKEIELTLHLSISTGKVGLK